jgi:hypothetical protein
VRLRTLVRVRDYIANANTKKPEMYSINIVMLSNPMLAGPCFWR